MRSSSAMSGYNRNTSSSTDTIEEEHNANDSDMFDINLGFV